MNKCLLSPGIFLSFVILALTLAGDSHGQTKTLFDEYPYLRSNAEKAKLDGYFIELSSDPAAKGYVLIFAPARRKAGRAAFIRSYIRQRGFDPSRFVFVSKTAEAISTQLWTVPAGADPPR